jgi:DNA-binding MarR family transcriptional regulator/N-acetylglutamate synthase-like GNAT family acetyltransferase
MSFYQNAGPMALGSRLRQVSERITQEANKIYTLYSVDIESRWFPVLYALMQEDGQSVAQLAQQTGHSQASISQIIKEMAQRDFATVGKDAGDGRKTIVTLSAKAQALLPTLQQQIADVGMVVEAMLKQTEHNLWKALDELDYLLSQQSLADRVNQQRKQRESQDVQIVPYTDADEDAFRQLNVAWISSYFTMEASDYAALDHPSQKIIEPGGSIFMALWRGEVVGTCALVKLNEATYELAKMAVTPAAQGKHIGWLLGQAIIAKARELGAKTVWLESNTLLEPAIRLYQKMGFQKIKGSPSVYQRSNIQMELTL